MFKNKLKALFGDQARADGSKPFEIRAEAGDDATIYIYDVIGWPWMEAADFVQELQKVTAGVIHLHINSPGGDVFDARAMQTALRNHPAKVIAHIDSLAASAATFLALGADEVVMVKGGFFMIHNAWSCSCGEASDFLEMAEWLEKVDGSIRGDYMDKTGASEEQVRAWMDKETWFTAAEALEAGFVDRIEGESEGGADNRFDLGNIYNNVPQDLKQPAARNEDNPQPDRAAMLRRVKLWEDFGA